jgi:hypothetical protein
MIVLMYGPLPSVTSTAANLPRLKKYGVAAALSISETDRRHLSGEHIPVCIKRRMLFRMLRGYIDYGNF